MLRKVVIALILINLAWWIWAQNWLAPIGLPSAPAGEPERLTRQIRPEALRVRILPPGRAASASPATAAPQASSPASEAPPPPRHRRRALPAPAIIQANSAD